MMRVRKTRRRSAWCPPYAIRDGRDHADIAGTYCGNAVERYKKYGTRQREWGGNTTHETCHWLYLLFI